MQGEKTPQQIKRSVNLKFEPILEHPTSGNCCIDAVSNHNDYTVACSVCMQLVDHYKNSFLGVCVECAWIIRPIVSDYKRFRPPYQEKARKYLIDTLCFQYGFYKKEKGEIVTVPENKIIAQRALDFVQGKLKPNYGRRRIIKPVAMAFLLCWKEIRSLNLLSTSSKEMTVPEYFLAAIPEQIFREIFFLIQQ